MSQEGIIDVLGSNPDIPVDFISDSGSAVPIANQLELLGEVVAAGVNPFRSIASGNTVTYQVQLGQENAASNPLLAGLASFDSAVFTVDPNGFVSLRGGSIAIDSIGVQGSSLPGTNPLFPDINGKVEFVGQLVVAGTSPLLAVSVAANQVNFQIQTSQAIAATDSTKVGLCNFDSSDFAVDANGFVTFIGGAAGDVVGPAGATSTAIAVYGDATGKLIANSIPTIDSNGNILTSASLSGATLSIDVVNSSNTASSVARMSTTVAGGTAGDAIFQASVSGGQVWTWGLDNSDSDAYVLSSSVSLGTTNVMRVATSGEITKPLQSAFLAYLPSSNNDVTGDGTSFIVGTTTAMTEVFDQNSDFNTNGTYTAPVTARCQFNGNILAQGATSSFSTGFNLLTSNNTFPFCNNSVAVAGNNGLGFSVLVDMDAGDTARIALAFAGSTKTIDCYGAADRRTNFSGFIAC